MRRQALERMDELGGESQASLGLCFYTWGENVGSNSAKWHETNPRNHCHPYRNGNPALKGLRRISGICLKW